MKQYIEQSDEHSQEIDFKRQRYPYCMVWTPLPLITALIPFIGHSGICNSEGIIHDFAGPYTVSVDEMAFGNPTKYVKLEIEDKEKWNEAVEKGDTCYRGRMHNICCDNCHSHVAHVLNQADYQGGGWNMVNVWWLYIRKGEYTGITGFLKTYAGFAVVCTLIIIISSIN